MKYPDDDYLIIFSGRRGESLLTSDAYGSSLGGDVENALHASGGRKVVDEHRTPIKPIERGPTIIPERRVKRKAGFAWR